MDLQRFGMGQLTTSTTRYAGRVMICLYLVTSLLLTAKATVILVEKVSACDPNTGQSANCVCNIGNVRCINLNPKLLAVPKDIPTNVKALGLTQNNILRIEENDFAGLEFLETILIQDNNISYIHPKALRNLYRLQILNLERNRLSQLDPTGLLFQHLSSMTQLALQQNYIRQLNSYSFLTMLHHNGDLTIKFTDNPIQCDCAVRALRDWQRNQAPQGAIKFEGMICANDPQKRPYDQVADSVFGNCSGSNSQDVTNTMFECPICSGERTYHACTHAQHQSCAGPLEEQPITHYTWHM